MTAPVPLEVQVRDDRQAGGADLGHGLATRDELTGRHVDGPAVRVEGRRAVCVEEDEQVAVAADAVVGVDDEAIVGGADVLALLGHDVDAVVRPVMDLGPPDVAEAAAEETARHRPEQIVPRRRADLRQPLGRRGGDAQPIRRGARAEAQPLGPLERVAFRHRDPAGTIADVIAAHRPVPPRRARATLTPLRRRPEIGHHRIRADRRERLGPRRATGVGVRARHLSERRARDGEEGHEGSRQRAGDAGHGVDARAQRRHGRSECDARRDRARDGLRERARADPPGHGASMRAMRSARATEAIQPTRSNAKRRPPWAVMAAE